MKETAGKGVGRGPVGRGPVGKGVGREGSRSRRESVGKGVRREGIGRKGSRSQMGTAKRGPAGKRTAERGPVKRDRLARDRPEWRTPKGQPGRRTTETCREENPPLRWGSGGLPPAGVWGLGPHKKTDDRPERRCRQAPSMVGQRSGTPRTRQSPLILAAFRPWGGSRDGRRVGSVVSVASPGGAGRGWLGCRWWRVWSWRGARPLSQVPSGYLRRGRWAGTRH